MAGCISEPLRFFEQCFLNTSPGGWLEMQDISLLEDQDSGTSLEGWNNLLNDFRRD
jgi:hypothetical protein